jgi:hypothetical protein
VAGAGVVDSRGSRAEIGQEGIDVDGEFVYVEITFGPGGWIA